MKLPKWFPINLQDAPHVPSAMNSLSPETMEGVMEKHSDVHETQGGGSSHRENEQGKCSNDEDSNEEQGPECNDEGYDDKGNNKGNDKGYDDSAETDDEFAFEYDDKYMS